MKEVQGVQGFISNAITAKIFADCAAKMRCCLFGIMDEPTRKCVLFKGNALDVDHLNKCLENCDDCIKRMIVAGFKERIISTPIVDMSFWEKLQQGFRGGISVALLGDDLNELIQLFLAILKSNQPLALQIFGQVVASGLSCEHVWEFISLVTDGGADQFSDISKSQIQELHDMIWGEIKLIDIVQSARFMNKHPAQVANVVIREIASGSSPTCQLSEITDSVLDQVFTFNQNLFTRFFSLNKTSLKTCAHWILAAKYCNDGTAFIDAVIRNADFIADFLDGGLGGLFEQLVQRNITIGQLIACRCKFLGAIRGNSTLKRFISEKIEARIFADCDAEMKCCLFEIMDEPARERVLFKGDPPDVDHLNKCWTDCNNSNTRKMITANVMEKTASTSDIDMSFLGGLQKDFRDDILRVSQEQNPGVAVKIARSSEWISADQAKELVVTCVERNQMCLLSDIKFPKKTLPQLWFGLCCRKGFRLGDLTLDFLENNLSQANTDVVLSACTELATLTEANTQLLSLIFIIVKFGTKTNFIDLIAVCNRIANSSDILKGNDEVFHLFVQKAVDILMLDDISRLDSPELPWLLKICEKSNLFLAEVRSGSQLSLPLVDDECCSEVARFFLVRDVEKLDPGNAVKLFNTFQQKSGCLEYITAQVWFREFVRDCMCAADKYDFIATLWRDIPHVQNAISDAIFEDEDYVFKTINDSKLASIVAGQKFRMMLEGRVEGLPDDDFEKSYKKITLWTDGLAQLFAKMSFRRGPGVLSKFIGHTKMGLGVCCASAPYMSLFLKDSTDAEVVTWFHGQNCQEMKSDIVNVFAQVCKNANLASSASSLYTAKPTILNDLELKWESADYATCLQRAVSRVLSLRLSEVIVSVFCEGVQICILKCILEGGWDEQKQQTLLAVLSKVIKVRKTDAAASTPRMAKGKSDFQDYSFGKIFFTLMSHDPRWFCQEDGAAASIDDDVWNKHLLSVIGVLKQEGTTFQKFQVLAQNVDPGAVGAFFFDNDGKRKDAYCADVVNFFMSEQSQNAVIAAVNVYARVKYDELFDDSGVRVVFPNIRSADKAFPALAGDCPQTDIQRNTELITQTMDALTACAKIWNEFNALAEGANVVLDPKVKLFEAYSKNESDLHAIEKYTNDIKQQMDSLQKTIKETSDAWMSTIAKARAEYNTLRGEASAKNLLDVVPAEAEDYPGDSSNLAETKQYVISIGERVRDLRNQIEAAQLEKAAALADEAKAWKTYAQMLESENDFIPLDYVQLSKEGCDATPSQIKKRTAECTQATETLKQLIAAEKKQREANKPAPTPSPTDSEPPPKLSQESSEITTPSDQTTPSDTPLEPPTINTPLPGPTPQPQQNQVLQDQRNACLAVFDNLVTLCESGGRLDINTAPYSVPSNERNKIELQNNIEGISGTLETLKLQVSELTAKIDYRTACIALAKITEELEKLKLNTLEVAPSQINVNDTTIDIASLRIATSKIQDITAKSKELVDQKKRELAESVKSPEQTPQEFVEPQISRMDKPEEQVVKPNADDTIATPNDELGQELGQNLNLDPKSESDPKGPNETDANETESPANKGEENQVPVTDVAKTRTKTVLRIVFAALAFVALIASALCGVSIFLGVQLGALSAVIGANPIVCGGICITLLIGFAVAAVVIH
jgi:hypothetical protein